MYHKTLGIIFKKKNDNNWLKETEKEQDRETG